MNNKPTFREQYDKIVSAYLKNELEPSNSCACFVGNLLNNQSEWLHATTWRDSLSFLEKDQKLGLLIIEEESNNLYTIADIDKLEANFMRSYYSSRLWRVAGLSTIYVQEQALYLAMESTLLLLKEIHESKGEVVEDYVFERRPEVCLQTRN